MAHQSQREKRLECPSVDRRTNRVYPYGGTAFSQERNDVLTPATMRMDLESIVLGEGSTAGHQDCVIHFIGNVRSRPIRGGRKHTRGCPALGVGSGPGMGSGGSQARDSFCGGQKRPKIKWCWWWFYNPINTLKLIKLYALKG